MDVARIFPELEGEEHVVLDGDNINPVREKNVVLVVRTNPFIPDEDEREIIEKWVDEKYVCATDGSRRVTISIHGYKTYALPNVNVADPHRAVFVDRKEWSVEDVERTVGVPVRSLRVEKKGKYFVHRVHFARICPNCGHAMEFIGGWVCTECEYHDAGGGTFR